jgi:tetratricopeptide (TPR) repeat protein
LWWGQYLQGSVAARLAIWQGTVKLIGQRPLLGYGADALGMVFPRVYPPELVYYQGRELFVDRAHNLFLDWTATAGVPGLLALCMVLIMFAVVVARALSMSLLPFKRALLIGVAAAVLGNIVNNLLSFDVTPTASATWLLMGVGVALAGPSASQAGSSGKGLGFWRRALVGLMLLGIGAAVWQMNARPLMADIAARTAEQHAQTGNWTGTIASSKQAVAHWPVEPAHHLLLSQAYRQQAVAEPAMAQVWLARAERALLAANQLRSVDPVIWLHMAGFYTVAARHYGSEGRQLADEAYRQALALAPHQATVYSAWGTDLLAEGDVERAAPLLRQAVALDASNGQVYLHLAATELALGRPKVALADYQEVVRLLPESSHAYAGLATSYWLLERPQEALLAVEKALQRDSQNAEAMRIHHEIQLASDTGGR